MTLLARRVNGALWAQANEDAARWAGSDVPAELVAEVVERRGGGASFWEVGSPADERLNRVAAALTCGTKKDPAQQIQQIVFRLVDRTEVEKLGIRVRETPGDSQDQELNRHHRELPNLTITQAIGLVRLLNAAPERRYKAAELAMLVARGLARRELPETVLNQLFLWKLYEQNVVKISDGA
jgi:hypothetical protein